MFAFLYTSLQLDIQNQNDQSMTNQIEFFKSLFASCLKRLEKALIKWTQNKNEKMNRSQGTACNHF